MPDSFGARLRQRREERQIDLIAISEQTKIKLQLLEALERDDVSHWPSGIFRRAYMRSASGTLRSVDSSLRSFSPSRAIRLIDNATGVLGFFTSPRTVP